MKNAVTATNVCTQSADWWSLDGADWWSLDGADWWSLDGADWWSHQPTMESRHLASMPIFASLGLEGCWSWYRPFCLETLNPPSVNSTCWLFVASSGKEKQKTWQNAVNSIQLTFGSNVKNFQKTKCWWRFFWKFNKEFLAKLKFSHLASRELTVSTTSLQPTPNRPSFCAW